MPKYINNPMSFSPATSCPVDRRADPNFLLSFNLFRFTFSNASSASQNCLCDKKTLKFVAVVCNSWSVDSFRDHRDKNEAKSVTVLSRCMNFVAAWKYYSAEGKEKDGDNTLFRESEASPDLGFTQVMLSIEFFCNLFLFIPSQLIY